MKTAAQSIYCITVLLVATALGLAIQHALDLDRQEPWAFPLTICMELLFPIGCAVRLYFGKTPVSKIVTGCIILCALWFGFVNYDLLKPTPPTAQAPRPANSL